MNNKEYIKQWKQEHKEEQREYQKRYYQKNKERLKKYALDYYYKHNERKEYKCVFCGTKINLGKFCDNCALDKTKVSRQVISLRRKKLRMEKQNESK